MSKSPGSRGQTRAIGPGDSLRRGAHNTLPDCWQCSKLVAGSSSSVSSRIVPARHDTMPAQEIIVLISAALSPSDFRCAAIPVIAER